MNAIGQLVTWLLGILLGLALLGGVIYLGFGPAIQQQTNDQSDQISTMQNNPTKGTVNIEAITGSERPANAQTFK